MARIRTIKPETFTSDDVAALTIHARWTWVGLWTHADDEGRARADPRLIKAAVWPIDDTVSAADVTLHLDEMERRGMICRYSVAGVAYLHVVNFLKHQRINRPSLSKHPACSGDVHGGLSESSVRTHAPIPDDSPQEQGTGNREVEQGTGKDASVRRPSAEADPLFDEFWSTYPRREAKGAARKAWDKATTRAATADILAGATRYRDQPGRDPRYTAHPATWLNADRWSDEPQPVNASANGHRPFTNPEDEDAYGGTL